MAPQAVLDSLVWERTWERRRTAPGLPTADMAALARAGTDLDQFDATLSPDEQDALRALVNIALGDMPFETLAAIPARDVLAPDEIALYDELRAEPVPTTGLRTATYVIMKGTRLCNLRCTYCNSWRDGPDQIMTFPVLARTIRDTLRDPAARVVEFVWHGGETTLLPTAFYQKALWLQQQFRRSDQIVRNRIQTNATRVSDEWIEFWRRYQFIVGVSLDGPPEIHDRRRIDVAGRPTAARVRAGLERLRDGGLDPRVLLVVDNDIADAGAARVLDYLLEIGINRVALLNVVPKNTAPGEELTGSYLSWPSYMTFLHDMFRLWWPTHVNRIVIRELADLARQLIGGTPLVCNFAGDCFGAILTVEPTGDVSACDRYVEDRDYVFGNVLHAPLPRIVAESSRLTSVIQQNNVVVDRLRTCPWFAVCHGGCPHDRRLAERYVPGHDDDCCGLAPLLQDMTNHIRASVPPTSGVVPVEEPAVGPHA
jgi:uncharacterized protein